MNSFLRACLVLSVILFMVVTSLIAQPGTLFSSFGTNGLFTDPSRQTFEKAIASQPDKKILIGSQGFYQGYQTFLIDRLLPNGSKDHSFGTDGTAHVLFRNTMGNLTSGINAIAWLPDGKIVAAGYAINSGTTIALARFLPDGTPDSLFGSNGTSLTGFYTDETVNGLAVQPDGKLVVCGSSSPDGTSANSHFFVARYLPDGSIDKGFGKEGIVVSRYTGSANAVMVKAGGNLIAGGYSTGTDGIGFHVECYTPSGGYDNSFGNNGVVDNRINGGFLNFINDIALQTDGKLIAAGRTNGGGIQTFTLVRYNSNGSFDNSFGTDGIVTSSFSGAAGEARHVTLTAKDRHILATGSRSDNNGNDFIIAAYTSNGVPDTAFGTGGIAATDFGGTDYDNSAVLCADGSVVALGSNTGRYPFAVRALAKYNGYPEIISLLVRIKRWLQNPILQWNGLSAGDDIASYRVEQSNNGRTGFTEIASVSGAAKAKEYSLTNSHLLPGNSYYRIKAIGADGSVRYSETVSIENAVSSLSVYPNPAINSIVIKGLKAEGTSYISLAGSHGNIILKAISNSNTQHRIVVSSLSKGTYYITVVAPDGSVGKETFVKE